MDKHREIKKKTLRLNCWERVSLGMGLKYFTIYDASVKGAQKLQPVYQYKASISII